MSSNNAQIDERRSNLNVQIDAELFNAASAEGKAHFNFWAKIWRNALANPDLPVDFIVKVLTAKNQETNSLSLTDVQWKLGEYRNDWTVKVEVTLEFSKAYAGLSKNCVDRVKSNIMELVEINPRFFVTHELSDDMEENFLNKFIIETQRYFVAYTLNEEKTSVEKFVALGAYEIADYDKITRDLKKK